MEAMKHKHVLMNYLYILVGSCLVAVAINSVFDPMNIVTGGVTGLAIVVKSLTKGLIPGLPDGIPLGAFNLICNIPLLLMGMKVKGKRFLARTLFATMALSFFLSAIPVIPHLPQDKLLLTLFGGVLSGAGTGLVFLAFATTGGTDLLAMILQHRIKTISVPRLMGFLDGAIVVLGAMVFGLDKSMYAMIVIFIVAKVSDSMIEGVKFAKMAYIISDHSEAISQKIIVEMERGITKLDATGMYTQTDRKMLLCVVAKSEIVTLKEIVEEVDPSAFVIISDVREAVGEGFLQYR